VARGPEFDQYISLKTKIPDPLPKLISVFLANTLLVVLAGTNSSLSTTPR
jgi:hypothetical protein